MDSKTIVDRYGAKLKGQQMLFTDYDYILRHTKFQSVDPDFNREALVHWWMNVYLPEYRGRDESTPYEIYSSLGPCPLGTLPLYSHGWL